MQLTEFSYSEYPNSNMCWHLEKFKLNDINLIVGNNASGKTRTLNVIAGLGKILRFPQLPIQNGTYYASIIYDKRKRYDYLIEISNNVIIQENLKINNHTFIERSKDGSGYIKNTDKQQVKFKIPINQLIVSRRDEIQFPYLEDLFLWAKSVKLIRFAKDDDKMTLSANDANINLENHQRLNESLVLLEIFKRGISEFKKPFQDKLISDMNKIGYKLESIEFDRLNSSLFEKIPSTLFGIHVKESDREVKLNQISMSEGMFRALAILIYFNYYHMKNMQSTILVDDIGEGLDYDRASSLIKLLISKSKKKSIQLVMSTNNKFVMNNTDLKYWQIINRVGSNVHIRNKFNSKELFEEFKYTGLDNFDFYSDSFYTGKVKLEKYD